MILLTYGTRPEYIKVKPVIDEMTKRGMKFKTLSTGQHKDIVPEGADFNLTMTDYEGNRLDSVMKNCLSIPDSCFEGITHILVQGDTTSVVGLSITALNRQIKVIHLEAGLRTFDVKNPFQEENNRMIVSTIADIHLCPTMDNATNLWDENISPVKTHIVGNTVLDNLLDYKKHCKYTNKVLVTMHRRENHNWLDQWFNEINQIAIDNPELEFIVPLHPNPNVQKWKHLLPNVEIIEPLNHHDLMELLTQVKMVITDSGGIQEECSFFNKKCLVCRKVTERPESVGLTSFMVKDVMELKGIFYKHIKEFEVDVTSPYGDGYASEKICDIFETIY
jgi:UDP-N-acetylglucosamine 2-epimerase (non-hydrolysing)